MSTPFHSLEGPQGKIPSRRDYPVPSGYFEELPMRVLSSIDQDGPRSSSAVTRPWLVSGPWALDSGRWAVAASVLLLVGLAWFWMPTKKTTSISGDPLLAHLTADDIVEGLDLHGAHAVWFQEATVAVWTEDPAWIHPQDEPVLDSFLWEQGLITVPDEEMTDR